MKNLLFILMSLLFSSGLLAQTTITGTIKDADNMPVPGASVLEEGTSNGTMSDADGKYSISVSPESKILTFSFIGMLDKKVEIAGQSEINVNLENDNVDIDEVVIVGYGVQKKSDVTGSLSSVNIEERL